MRLPTNLRLDPNGTLGKLATALQDLLSRTNGQVNRNTDKASEWVSVKDLGTVDDGAANAAPAFSDLFTSTAGDLRVPKAGASYKLDSDVTPSARDVALRIDPEADFSGTGKLKLNSQVPFQSTPIWSNDLLRKTFDTNVTGYGNVFMRASYAVSNLATVPVVALYSGADGQAANSKVWALNTVAYANHATCTSISYELNCGVLVAGGTAYGLVIASAGDQGQPQNAIQIQANTSAGQFINGIKFNFRDSIGAVTGSPIEVRGSDDGLSTCERFIYAHGMSASLGELDLPSFAVEATVASTVNRLRVQGAATGTNPKLKATGTDTNVTVEVVGKGSGGVNLVDGGSANKVRINTTGIGFYGTAPVAKPTVTGSRGGNAALASLLTALAGQGLITDSSTA